jgi:hypothetical protein
MSIYFNSYERIRELLLSLKSGDIKGEKSGDDIGKACPINAVEIFISRLTMTEKKLQRQ